MTRDDVIRMAEEAGFYFHDAGHAPTLHTNPLKYSEKCFERFATLVAAAEREACAKECDDIAFDWHKHAAGGPVAAYNACASAIRARGEK